MDEYFYYKRSHVPAFGSWDCNHDDLPFTQCFETATKGGGGCAGGGLLRYSYSQDRDLYVTGDLYENDVVTPTMIVVPRNTRKTRYPKVKEEDKKEQKWVVCDEYGGGGGGGYDVKEPPSPVVSLPPSPSPPTKPARKAVDEDLYKISPQLLRAQCKKKKGWGFFSSCLRPCVY